MLSIKKIIFLVFLASMTCGSSAFALNTHDDLEQELRTAQVKAQIAKLKKEAAEDELKAAQAEQQKKNAEKAQEQKSKTESKTGLTASANRPRPPLGTSTVGVVTHNVEVETARALKSAQNFLKGKGWKWRDN